MAAAQKKQDFIIHVPKRDPLKRHSIIRFNTNLNVDINQWPNKEVHLRREDNRKEILNDAIVQEYGAGSEYGKAAREEARRKKYGRLARSYKIDKQPWLLDIKESDTKTKKYKSIVERTGEHADYWIFVKQGNKFFAHKVSEWYQFLPQVQHKVLDIEQAEEQFQQRNRVMNQFALKAQIQQQMKDSEEDGGKTVRASNLIIKDKDVMSSDEDDNDDDAEDGDNEEKKKQKKRNAQKQKNQKKDKKVRVENGDEVAAYESDDGDDEGREFDYMSDSGSDSDRETKTVEEKIDEALVGVGDEQGLKNMIEDRETDESDEEEEEGVTEENKDLANKLKEQDDDANGQNRSDDSDDEDPDATDINSPLLLQAKRQDDRKRPAGDGEEGSSKPKKIKTEKGSSQQLAPPAPLITSGASAVTEAEQKMRIEDQIRRCLMRRPHTTKELLSNIRPQFENIEKTALVNKLAEVLKVIGPKQFRKNQGKKEILYFSLEP